MMITMLRDQMPDRASLSQEQALIDEETRCIVDKVIEIGEGSIAAGVVRAFQAGFLDIPFAPSKYNAGKDLMRFRRLGDAPAVPARGSAAASRRGRKPPFRDARGGRLGPAKRADVRSEFRALRTLFRCAFRPNV